MRRFRGFTYIDLIAITILVPLLACATTSWTCWSRQSGGTSNRVKCASNLRQIGQALLLYANENRGAYPRTLASATGGQTWGTGTTDDNPFVGTETADDDLTAAMFLLIRTQDIGSEVFTCPSSNAEKDLYGGGSNGPLQRSNFSTVTKNLSYSYGHSYPNTTAISKGYKLNSSIGPDFAIAADINPGTAGTGNRVTAVRTSSSTDDMKGGNSNNHDRDGQNVLYGDGHVEFQTNPFVGVERDNIYTTQAGVIVGSPENGNDSVLLPMDD